MERPEIKPDVGDLFLQPWRASEREDFLSAVKRHRRKSWRITALCLLAYTVLATVMSILLAPLLYCIAGLLLDVLNKLFLTPDLLAFAGNLVAPIVDDPAKVPLRDLLKLLLLASAPGLVFMAVAVLIVSRTVKQSALFDSQQPVGRPPDLSRLAERQMANALEEMAIAAMIPAPVVTVIPGGANAAAAGPDRDHASIMVGETLLTTLDRKEMQGVAAHLVGAIADDDMRIGLRTASLLGVFALITRLSVDWQGKQALACHRKLLFALLSPTPASRAFIRTQLQDPFSASTPHKTDSETSNTLSWREWLIMPLMGPVMMSGFLGGLVNTMILTPAICYGWRQRKYMADATAVRLTRQPDSLAAALIAMNNVNASLLSAAWASHLCVVDPGRTNMIVPIFPALEKRLAALISLGASHHALPPRSGRAVSLWIKLLVGFLLGIAYSLILIVVPLMAVVSAMLTMIFTLLPAAVLHALLR